MVVLSTRAAPDPRLFAARGVAIAIGTVSVATVATLALYGLIGDTPFALLHLAVLVSAVAGGTAAGWLAVGFAAVAAVFVVINPAGGPATHPQALAAAGMSLTVDAVLVVLVGLIRAREQEARGRQAEVERVNRLYDALIRVNHAVVTSTSRDELLERVCRALVERGGFRMAWIGWHNPAGQQLEPIASWGDTDGYLDGIEVATDDRPEGHGPSGTAFREGRTYISNDLPSDPAAVPWRNSALPRGLRASAAIPVRQAGAVRAVLAVYATEPGFFGSREIALLEEAAADIAFGLDGFVRDDEREGAEAVAVRERALVDMVFDSVPGVVYLYDRDGRFLRWNRSFLEESGYTADEVAAMHPLEFLAGPDREQVAARIAEVFENGGSSVEAGFVRKDGTVTPYLFTGRRVTLDGEPCLVGMGIDISDRVAAEDEARALELRFETVVEHLREGLVISDPARDLVYWNPAALAILGFDDPAQGRRHQHAFTELFDLFDLDGRPLAAEEWPMARVRRGEALLGLEMRVRRRDMDPGWERIVSYAGGQAAYGDDRHLAFITLHDVTGRKRGEQALLEAKHDLERKVDERTSQLQAALVRAEAADRLKSSFLATMSHELRTPLNSIIGFTGIVLQGLAGPLSSEQTKQLTMVRGSARHLLELINDVLDISKIEAGQLEVRLEPFDLRASIERAVEGIRPIASRKELKITASIPDFLPAMVSDRRRVDQILINLLNNAVKFTERGSIRVEVHSGAGITTSDGAPGVRVAVIDTGVGIRTDDLDTLFQPFRQVDAGLSRQHEGTGLGLAICRRLAQLLGGEVRAESTWGVGSEFSVILPLNQEP